MNTPNLHAQPPGQAPAGEYVDLCWNYPDTAVSAVDSGVWFCPVARAANADHAWVYGS